MQIAPNNRTEDSLLDILRSSLIPFKGGGMRVLIRSARGHEKCPATGCKTVFSYKNDYTCREHKSRPHRVYLDITGKKLDGGRVRVYHAPDGTELQIISAISLKDQITEQIRKGTFSATRYRFGGEALKFKNYKNKYLSKMRERSSREPGDDGWLSRSGLEDIEKYHRNYLGMFDDVLIHDFNFQLVQIRIDGLRNKSGEMASNHIKGKIVELVKHLLEWAREQGDLVTSPKLPRVKKDKALHNVLTEEQQLEIIGHIPKEHQPIFRWAKETGRRINEYRAMRVREVAFEREEYYIGGAFDKEHYKAFPKVEDKGGMAYPLTDALKAILKDALKDRVYGPDDWVFLNPDSGKHYTQSTADKIFTDARKKTGYKITLNEFGRHSFAVQHLAAGASYTQVAVLLNNTAEVVEKNYSRWNTAQRAKILKMRETG